MSRQELNVSRETLERLKLLEALLRKWTKKINLVSKSTLDHLWERHILDSAQLWDLAPKTYKKWVDLGSGGGFPGLVIAILAMESDTETVLVESDLRKSLFLKTALRETEVRATVINERIEKIDPLNADVLSARALADLPTLLGFAERHMHKDALALFPKGVQWRNEIEAARKNWQFDFEVTDSKIENGSVLLSITGVQRV